MRIVFTVDLKSAPDTLLTPAESETQASLKIALIPSLKLGDRLFRHGETFVLSNAHARYVKGMIDSGKISQVNCETIISDVDAADVNALLFEDNGVIGLEMLPNDFLATE